MIKIMKKAVSKGIEMGCAFHYVPFEPIIPSEAIDDVEHELARYHDVINKAVDEVQEIASKLSKTDEKNSQIFYAHEQIIKDVALIEMIEDRVRDQIPLERAIFDVFDEFINMLKDVEDELIQERVIDLYDVRRRLLRILSGKKESSLSHFTKPTVIIAKNLTPSDTATMDRNYVIGLITEEGGETSHTAIIAKSFGLPAFLGVKNVFQVIPDQKNLILDAINDEIIIEPTEEIINTYKITREKYVNEQQEINQYLSQVCYTKDGYRVDIALNIGSDSDTELENEAYSDGVGLFRTEFLFMEKNSMPAEEEQFRSYAKVLKAFKNKQVIIRTLDIGGDKEISYLPQEKEDNPFLGNRAIRLMLQKEELFLTQLRALIRASKFGKLGIMFPMIGTIDDIRECLKMVEKAKKQVLDCNHEINDFEVGIMIEIPSIALMADKVAKEVDFFSFGTNDLTQYLHAVDRMNHLIESYYQPLSPSMFRIMKIAIDAFNKEHKSSSVCGELGGHPLAGAILVGLGIKKLSMSKNALAMQKKIISSFTMDELKDYASNVLELNTQDEVIDYLSKILKI